MPKYWLRPQARPSTSQRDVGLSIFIEPGALLRSGLKGPLWGMLFVNSSFLR